MSFKQAIVATMMMMLAAAARVDKVVAVSAVTTTTTTTVRRRVKAGKNGPPPPPQGQYYNLKKNPKSSKKNSPTPSPVTSPIPNSVALPTPAPVLHPLPYRPHTVVPVVAMTTDEPTDNIDSGFCFADSCPDGNFCDFYLGDRGECVECPPEYGLCLCPSNGVVDCVEDCETNCSFDKGPVDPNPGPTDCSINQSCPDEYFCNFDIGDAFCEECPTETDCADFAGDGLQDFGVEDCEKKCSFDDLTPVDPNPGPTDCSNNQSCPPTNFCNFEDGTSGGCEECPWEEWDCDLWAPELAVEDCKYYCSFDDVDPNECFADSCPDEYFCNFDDSPRCEECPTETDCADFAGDGLPDFAVEDCEKNCSFDYQSSEESSEDSSSCTIYNPSCPDEYFCNFYDDTSGGCEECPSGGCVNDD